MAGAEGEEFIFRVGSPPEGCNSTTLAAELEVGGGGRTVHSQWLRHSGRSNRVGRSGWSIEYILGVQVTAFAKELCECDKTGIMDDP
jgi:hypothetical protein